MTTPASAIRFGRVTVLPTQRRVLVDGHAVGGRAFDILQALLARRGQVVSKHELLDGVWPGVVVEENNLEVQICALRKLLGPRAIVTVPGRGYSFDASIEVRESAGPVPLGAQPRVEARTDTALLRGRDEDAAALALLIRHHRMVTVAGPGGVGKSRLAREVGARAGPPVVRLELAQERTAIGLAAELADALDLGLGRAPTPRQLARALTGRRALVVIENGEHAVREAADLADAFQEAPGVRVVCTSQAPLGAIGERVLRLKPLRVPAGDGSPDAAASPSMEMLLDTLKAIQPRDAFTRDEAQDAAAICRHLDGLPLAIELAGTRVPLLGLAGVRRRLNDRFHLLACASRARVARQQSLLASMQWSWRQLSAREAAALSTLARQPGRFTLATACHALASLAPDEWEVMELLGALVDKSLVMSESGSRSAFRLLESTRAFAQDCAAPLSRVPASG